MYFVDNGSAVPVMPQVKPVSSATPQFFTEGGNGTPPTYPGPDWFNIFQLELLNVLKEAQIDPDKANHTQLVTAMKKLFLDASSNGSDIPDKAAFLLNLGLVTSRFAVVTSSQTITIPNWVTEIYVSGCAGGGGAGGGGGGDTTYYGGGGGGGGAGESIIKRKFTVSAGASLSITIGASGVGATPSVGTGNDGTAGGNTVIGSLITLTGGGGGKGGLNAPTPGGTIGGGKGGSGYPNGSSGSDGILTAGTAAGGVGSSALFGGGGGNGRAVTVTATEADGVNAYGYGSGGGGGGGKYGNASMGGGSAAPGGSGGNGAPGIVIIEW